MSVENILPFFPADAMAEYDGIFAAATFAADAELARLTAYWAERAAESERAFAEADARSAELVRRRREYETAVIFLINPHKVRYSRDRAGRILTCPCYINLGPRLNWSWGDEEDKCVDARPAPAGCYYRTAAELGLDNAAATRHYEDKAYLAECTDVFNSCARRASEYVVATERVWGRTLAAMYRRVHALATFARQA